MSSLKNIVILGGSYAGVSTAHRLLKQSAKAGTSIRITLVSPNTHVYWNIASIRAIVPGGFPDEKVFASIAAGFKQYPAENFDFVVGTAEELDVENKKVVVSKDGGRSNLDYDFLVLATGSRTKEDSPFKGKGSYQESLDMLHEWQSKVKNAESIYVAGAGATGVETAGELGFAYGTTKKITLVSHPPGIISQHSEQITNFPSRLQVAPQSLKVPPPASPRPQPNNSKT